MSAKAPMEQPSLIDRDSALSFVDRAYESYSTAIKTVVAENIRRTIGKFAACQGEFFLIIERHLDSCRRPRDENMILITDLWLGIIEGQMSFGEAGTPFRFPIRMPYVSGNFYQDPILWEYLHFLPECNYATEMFNYFRQGQPGFSWKDLEQPGLHMAIGDEEVKDLIRQYQWRVSKLHGEYPLMIPIYRMCLLLERFLHNFPEQEALLKSNRKLFAEAREKMKM